MTYDAVILGGGPGGYEAALWVSRLGGKAAVIEKDELGGVCTNRGCIPTKALAAGCESLEAVQRAGEFGITVPSYSVDVDVLFKRRDRVSLTMRKGVEKLLSDAGVEVVRAAGRIKSASEVEAGGNVLKGKNLVIATGSEPSGLPGMPLDHSFIVSGDDAAAMAKLPENVVIVGGGFIGCEFASIYSRLGCKVALIEALPRILPLEDADVSSALEKELAKNVKILAGSTVQSVDQEKRTVKAGGQEIPADIVLMAVGRRPVLPEGIDKIKVEHDKSGIKVDSRMRTAVKNVYAVGDAVYGMKLAHVAYAGGECAARNIMGADCEANFSAVPWCVFTRPEIARVGITEQEAKGRVRVGRADYMSNGKARVMGERGGMCKVIADDKSGVMLGVHMVGVHASDLIGEAALAVKNRLTVADVAETIHPHPTLTEIFKEACSEAISL